jgi:3-keto-5-aminohexanoate cleavage enzyme
MEKIVITAAVTGSLTTRAQQPALPHTPGEIARAAVDSCKAGASVVHLHARDPLTGRPVNDAGLLAEAIRIIRDECPMIINVTTGGAPGTTPEERISTIPILAADPKVKPEIASLNCGSQNFGVLDRKKKQFVFNDVMANPWSALLYYGKTMKQWGIKPELEIYEAGMINNANVLVSLDALKAPLHFQFVLGVLGGLPATVENLVFLKNSIPPGATWSVCAVGIAVYALSPVAIATGGHVRVGFEDCVHIRSGVLAESNAQIVAKMVRICEEMGRDVATPAEAREILGI